MFNSSEYGKQRRAKFKAAGLCTMCGKNPPKSPGRALCARCADYDKKTVRNPKERLKKAKERREKNKAAGQCSTCGGQPALGNTRCDHCSDQQRRYREKQVAAGFCPACCTRLPADGQTTCDPCREIAAARRLAIRDEVLQAYGGRCACPGCTVTEPKFLQLDHIAGDGRDHRESVGKNMYTWSRDNGFPRNLQLLCANCNAAKGANGVCPHRDNLATTVLPLSDSQQKYVEAKIAAFAAYGGFRCACPGCTVTEPRFLQIDHIDGGGAEQRRQPGGKAALYLWLKRKNYPPGFQVLCANCNMAKGFYGQCPHAAAHVTAS